MTASRIALAAAIAALAAAGTAPETVRAQASDQAYNTIKRIGTAMDRCWFATGDPAFAGYAYSPEPNATTAPRILIVPKKTPDALPALVVELRTSRGKTGIAAYGPLAASPAAARIGADLRRWLAGSDACN